MRSRIAFAASVSLALLCCNSGRVSAAETGRTSTNTDPAPSFDPRDFTGIWMQTPGRPFNTYPLTPEYQAILKQRRADEAAGKPFQVAQNRCLPAGLAATMTTGAYPIEIFYQKGGREILFQKENVGALYRVYLNRPHKNADELYPMFYGDSIGHWENEGNVLVIDSVSLGATSAFDLNTPHSDALHVVQRLRRISYDTLEDEITFDDPKALTKPITSTVVFKFHPDWEIEEYECTNERLMFDEHGNQAISKSAQP
jgi:hypothetical protein